MQNDLHDFFDSNMALLKKNQPETYQLMMEYGDNPLGDVVSSPTGKPNLKVTKEDGQIVFLHDTNDPEKEIPLFFQWVAENSNGVVTLIGMGLGYTPCAILKQREHIRYLVVFELNPGVFLQALKYSDLSPMLSDSRLLLSVGPDPDINKIFEPADLTMQMEPLHNLRHMTSFAINPDYELLNEKVFTYTDTVNMGGGAILGTGQKFSDNRFRHLSIMPHNSLLEKLRDVFKDVPAFIVASGPSLDKNIHLLKEAKGKSVIIAVDSALPALFSEGITPDFVTSIDPLELSFEKMATVVPYVKDIALICSSWNTVKTPKIFPSNQIFWFFGGRPMEGWVNSMMGGKLLTAGASTVAHLNLASAVIMGCSPIVFVGQDLAFSGKTSHAKNVSLSEDDGVKILLESEEVRWVDGIHGNQLPTSRVLENYKRFFEETIHMNEGHYINASADGAHIKGTEVKDLDAVIETYCGHPLNLTERLAPFLEKKNNPDYDTFLKEFRPILKEIKNLRKLISKSDQKAESVTQKLEQQQKTGGLWRQFSEIPSNTQRDIHEIDLCHKKLDGSKKVWSILEEITRAGLKQSEREKFAISKLANDPKKYSEWISKNLVRLKGINHVRTQVLDIIEKYLSMLEKHFSTEKKLIHQLKKEPDSHPVLSDLAKLYFEMGDYVLAEPVCEQLININADDGYANFVTGCIALLRNNFLKAEEFFNKALHADSDFEKQITVFRNQLGSDYLSYSVFFKSKDKNTYRNMLLKGLKICPDHHQLQQALFTVAEEELKMIMTGPPQEMSDGQKSLIDRWYSVIKEFNSPAPILPKEKAAEFARLFGSLQVSQNNLSEALDAYKVALSHVNTDPEYYLLAADACFAMHDYDNGVIYLSNAVSINRNYAKYWENMGNNLFNTGKYNDAMAAYEQCLIALPEKIDLLKKIGDCYLKTGNAEAAKECYSQLKNKLMQTNKPENKGMVH
ncbi:MAG: DUF115 domain-containing protein [Proteobacteria bacterium]|nr:DUF115 domain-containing protein [Pseudomonadota bacterium]